MGRRARRTTLATGTCRANRRAGAGFTLIEMLVLIIIMAILAGIAVPAYSRRYARTAFDHAVDETVAMLTDARRIAVDTGGDVLVTVDQRAGTWTMQPETVSDEQAIGAAQTVDAPVALATDTQTADASGQTRTYQLPDDVAVADFRSGQDLLGTQSPTTQSQSSERTMELRFHEDGTCDGAWFALVSADGFEVEMDVSPLTSMPTTVESGFSATGGSSGRAQ